jgi:hypothetical protein
MVYGELRDWRTEELLVSATLSYIADAVARRNYTLMTIIGGVKQD